MEWNKYVLKCMECDEEVPSSRWLLQCSECGTVRCGGCRTHHHHNHMEVS